MPDQQSILVIFDLLNNSAPVTPGARKVIDNILKNYPYFLPARYIKSVDIYRKESFSPTFNSISAGYIGNQILFNQFLQSVPPITSSYQDYDIDPFDTAKEGEIVYNRKQEKSIFDDPQSEESNTLPARKSKAEFKDTTNTNAVHDNIKKIITNTVTDIDVENAEDAEVEEIFEVKENIETEKTTQESKLKSETVKTQDELQAEADAFILEFLNKSNKSSEKAEEKPIIDNLKESVVANTNVENIVDIPTNDTINAIIEEKPNEAPLVSPIFTNDYFRQQGEQISNEVPEDLSNLVNDSKKTDEEDKSLMVMMSFSEWLNHFRKREEEQTSELTEQKALKSIWQKEKLAAALEEENDEIPEDVFDMAMNSISREDNLASESLAEIHIKQGKYDKAIEMYKKLSLRNTEKSVYFAQKIEEISKNYLS